MMRTILLISLILVLQSCVTEKIDKITRVYKIENGTNREITMKFYRFGKFRRTEHITGEGLIFESKVTDATRKISVSGALNADSLVIIYDDKKVQTFYLDTNKAFTINPPDGRNIYDDAEYEIIHSELYRFVFTEQDYENAAYCSGNCECHTFANKE